MEPLAQRHRDDDFPCDALWLDIDYMDGYRVFTWDTESFPDGRGMVKRLGEQGFRVITIVDPGVKYEPGYWVFDQGLERTSSARPRAATSTSARCGRATRPSPTSSTDEARAWWGKLNAARASGLAGIWNDMNEPATGIILEDDAVRPRGVPARSLPQPVRPAHGDGHD